MHTLGDMAKSLNRPAVYLHGLQTRFELPAFVGAGYSDAYLAFLRTIVFLRMLNVSVDSLCDLWHLERKLLQLLHVDSIGSPTWFLDNCGKKSHPRRRLLLTNYDMGVELPSRMIQLGLKFDTGPREFFTGKEMGEDAMRVLSDYLKNHKRIRADMNEEITLARAATVWAKRMIL